MKLRRQLLLVSLVALALPWAGCQYLRQVDAALAEGQLQALEATAQAVAGRLASAPELIAPDTLRLGRPPGAQLYLNALPQAPRLDGYGEEWRLWQLPARRLQDGAGDDRALITLGRHRDTLHGLLTVADATPSEHDPRSNVVASGDAIEIHTRARTYTLPVAAQGNAKAFWRNPRTRRDERELRLRGRWSRVSGGYQLEFTLPLALTAGDFGVRVLDRSTSGDILHSTSSLASDGLPGRLVHPLAGLQEELKHFQRDQLRLVVVDSEGFILADAGDTEAFAQSGSEPHWLKNWFYRRLQGQAAMPPQPPSHQLAAALTGRDPSGRHIARSWFSGPRETRLGAVSAPVITRVDNIIERPLLGRVIALQSGHAATALTQSAGFQLWLVSAAAAGTALILLLGYASWLSWRIRRLHRAARSAVDSSGRLRGAFPRSRLGDELGALNHAFASLLGELDQYHQYLRTLASKLSHELRTPLAVVRGSLDNLTAGDLDGDSRRFAERALEGSNRLTGILNSLSAASDLEASIRRAQGEPGGRSKEQFDLADFLHVMCDCYRDAHAQHVFSLDCPPSPQPCFGAPELLAQLLDKLVDNAASFAPEGSEISLTLVADAQYYRLSVSNHGPSLPEGFNRKLFDSLVSVRADGDRGGHLGLGLHIARLIAEFHEGKLSAKDRADGDGVTFTLELPRAR